MTDHADPDESNALAQFLRDWTTLWHEELQAQARDPEATPHPASPPDMTAALALWRTAMGSWADTLGMAPAAMTGSRERATAPRTAAGTPAPDPRDAEIERLARRIDELEVRLARLETPRRRRS